MNKKLKRKWLKALRSGAYTQGQDMLRDKERFCCLGVLCDISQIGKWTEDDNYEYKETINEFTIPRNYEWNIKPETINKLISMNDSGGKNFFEIADYIEENL